MRNDEDNKCIIISAPSGAGKTSITKYLLATFPNLVFSISATTRKCRASEEDGKDYHFMTEKEFKVKIANDEFIEWEEVFKGVFYGTLKSEVEKAWGNGKSIIFDTDVEGGLSLTKYFVEKALTIFVKTTHFSELEQRLLKRGSDTPGSIKRRLVKAKKELSYEHLFDTTIINDELDEAKMEARIAVKSFLS